MKRAAAAGALATRDEATCCSDTPPIDHGRATRQLLRPRPREQRMRRHACPYTLQWSHGNMYIHFRAFVWSKKNIGLREHARRMRAYAGAAGTNGTRIYQ